MPTSPIFPVLLTIHILAGTVGLAGGVLAMASRKAGAGLHRQGGLAYVYGMLTMCASAAVLTLWEPDRLTLVTAFFTPYLVLTSRRAAQSRLGDISRWQTLLGAGCAAGYFHGAWLAWSGGTGGFQGMAMEAFIAFGGLALLALLLDVNYAWRARDAFRPRLARHLWRMCLAYFLAATSLFLGQQDDVFPFMLGSPLLFVPSLATLLFMLFWVLRIRLAKQPLRPVIHTTAKKADQ